MTLLHDIQRLYVVSRGPPHEDSIVELKICACAHDNRTILRPFSSIPFFGKHNRSCPTQNYLKSDAEYHDFDSATNMLLTAFDEHGSLVIIVVIIRIRDFSNVFVLSLFDAYSAFDSCDRSM